jgi:hypothetical protein
MAQILRMFAIVAALWIAAAASAQTCSGTWLPGDAYPGVNGGIHAMIMADPDGPGPLPTMVIMGGLFSNAGTIPAANNIAAWDPSTGLWYSLGSGLNGRVRALAVLNTGELVAAGDFTAAGSTPAVGLAKWDGSSWTAIGTPDNTVYVLATLPSGDLVAGGGFFTIGGVSATGVAKRSATTGAWSTLGSGIDLNGVLALAVLPSGNLAVGGAFNTAGGVAAKNVAIWNPSTGAWAALGQGLNNPVYSIAASGSDIYAGGSFSASGSTSMAGMAHWNGTTWSAMGSGISSGTVDVIYPYTGSSLVLATGEFTTAGSAQVGGAAFWNGSSWSAFGGTGASPASVTSVLPLPNGDLLLGGFYNMFGTVRSQGIVRVSAAGTPQALAPVLNFLMSSLATTLDGDLVAGGQFTQIGGVSANRVALRHNGAWQPLGGGVSSEVDAVAVLPSGDIVVGGFFNSPASNIARWSNGAWFPFGTGASSYVRALAVAPNGDLIAGGAFGSMNSVLYNSIARWNGSTWSGFGSGANSNVYAVAALPGGDVVAGGAFTTMGGTPASRIARWNGAAWSQIGQGVNNDVNAVAVLPGGDLVIGGNFTTPYPHIAQWSVASNAWAPLGQGLDNNVYAISISPAGDVLAGGAFLHSGSLALNGIGRWDGAAWSSLGSGVSGRVWAISTLAGGDTYAGGDMTAPAPYLSVWRPTPLSIAAQPTAGLACPTGGAAFSINVPGASTYQWQARTPSGTWRNLGLSPVAIPCTPAGSTTALASTLNAPNVTITIAPCPGDMTAPQSFRVRCVSLGPCGGFTSSEAPYTICPADFNCSNSVEVLDIFDFLDVWFAAGHASDFDHNGVLQTNDIFVFLNAWFTGC